MEQMSLVRQEVSCLADPADYLSVREGELVWNYTRSIDILASPILDRGFSVFQVS